MYGSPLDQRFDFDQMQDQKIGRIRKSTDSENIILGSQKKCEKWRIRNLHSFLARKLAKKNEYQHPVQDESQDTDQMITGDGSPPSQRFDLDQIQDRNFGSVQG